MGNPRYHIVSMLGATASVAVGFAALREANDQWDSGLFSLTLALLLTAALLAIHRNDARRAFWIGFALFGSTYLSLSLIPATEARLITTQALKYLDQAPIVSNGRNRIQIISDLARIRVHNLSPEDLLVQESRLNATPEQEQLRLAYGQTIEVVLGSRVFGSSVSTHHYKPEQYENIVLKANPDGEIVRIKDLATVRPTGTTVNFVRIGHSLFALLFAYVGAALSRKLHPLKPKVRTNQSSSGGAL